MNKHKYYYGNVDKYSPKYEPQSADQFFLKLNLKKVHNKTHLNYNSTLKSNVFLLTDNYLILDKNNYQMGSYFFKTSLNYQYFYENDEYDTHVFFENFNFLFLFKYNLLYSLEIYKLHCNILLKFIK